MGLKTTIQHSFALARSEKNAFVMASVIMKIRLPEALRFQKFAQSNWEIFQGYCVVYK